MKFPILLNYCIIITFFSGCVYKHIRKDKKTSLTILYTGSAYGEIKPCGCSKEGDMGGLARRATYIENLKKENKNIIILDTGDNFKEPSQQGRLKARTMLRGMKMMGYDAMTFGERDFVYGSAFLAEHSIGLWTAENIQIKNMGKNFITPYIIKKLPNDLKIAVIGLSDPELFSSEKHHDVEISDPVRAWQRIRKEINNEHIDLVVLLIHAATKKANELLKEEGVDIVINGHIDGLAPEDEVILYKNSLLLHPKERGQQIGRVDAVIEKGTVSLTNSFVPLTPEIADHPLLTSLYNEYNKKVKEIFFESLQKRKTPHSIKNYISENSCKKCHPGEHDIWKRTKHATAFRTLRDSDKHHDPECILCHTTGFNKEGGFISETMTENLANVQCENCHGPAEKHTKDTDAAGYGVNARNACKGCHNRIHSPGFDFEKYWEKIKH